MQDIDREPFGNPLVFMDVQAARACLEKDSGEGVSDNNVEVGSGSGDMVNDVDVYVREDSLLFHEPPTLVHLLRRMPIVGRVLQNRV